MKSRINPLIICIVFDFGLAQPTIIHAQTQPEMNLQARHDFEMADAKLNKIYKRLLDKIDTQAQTKLKTAQLTWIAFRDAQAGLEADFVARGGTMAPTIYSTCLKSLTDARITELEKLTKDYGN